ncbi:hypothetical protein [Roseivivax sp.]
MEFQKLLELSAVVLALPYYFGFIYLNAYYGTFGVSITELDFSQQYIYASAFSGLMNAISFWFGENRMGPIIIVSLALLLVFCVRGVLSANEVNAKVTATPVQRLRISWLLPWSMFYLIVVSGLHFVASSSGEHVAKSDFPKLKNARAFLIKPDSTETSLVVNRSNLILDYEDYKFLAATAETIFLIRHVKTSDTERAQTFYTVRLPKHADRLITTRFDTF